VGQNHPMDDLNPERPRDAGVPEETPESVTAIEGARTLANEARERLREDGFTDDQIDQWAKTFITENDAGSVEDFITWIRLQEG
jgi:hypothetical protein